MPVYDFRNEETGEEWEEQMSYDEMKCLTSEGPIRMVYKKVNFLHAPGSDGGGRVPDHFKEKMAELAERNPNTPLADQYGSKSHKEIKTREAVKKIKKKAGGSLIG